MVTSDRKGNQCYEAESPDEGSAVCTQPSEIELSGVYEACESRAASSGVASGLPHRVRPGALVEGAKQMGWQLN